MSSTVSSIIDYVPEPEEADARRKMNLLRLLAVVSLSLAAIGYMIIIFLIY